MDPEDIARRLLAFVREIEMRDVVVSDFPHSARDLDMWRSEFGVDERYGSLLWEEIGMLQMALNESDWVPDVSEIPQEERDRWTFGKAFTLHGTPREIVRGFLQPLRVEPVLRRVPDTVALYLISIDEGEDFLKRENHNMGVHYHYLNWKEERSNAILSWDTRWVAPVPPPKTPMLRALFVEPHGDENNADFRAKYWLWGPNKRRSMYTACEPDLRKWPIEAFKCASNNSSVVYPSGRTLTPHPTAVAAATAKTALKAKALKKRRR